MGRTSKSNGRVCEDKLAPIQALVSENHPLCTIDILDHVPDAIILTDPHGVIVKWLGNAASIFGLVAAEAMGQNVMSLVHRDAFVGLEPQILRTIDECGTYSGEIVCVRKDSSTITVEVFAKPLLDDEGRVRSYIATCRDLTQRKRAEEERSRLMCEQLARADAEGAARRASFLARATTELGASLDYAATVEKIVRLAVPAIADYAALDLGCDDGTTMTAAVAHVDASKEPIFRALRAPGAQDGWGSGPVMRVLRSRSSEVYADIDADTLEHIVGSTSQAQGLSGLGIRSAIVVALATSDASLATLSLFRSTDPHGPKDLSLAEEFAHGAALALENARLYKKAQEATRLRDEFLGTVSHELRTPLNAVLGWTRMLRSGALNGSSQDRALATIERNATLQARLVEDLLDASRIVMGKLRLELRTIDLSGPIRAAIEAVRPAATAKSVVLDSSIERAACFVEGDPNRVQQIVWNLLVNAIKFTPHEGKVELVVCRSGQHARIIVRDTGEGIRPEFLPYVFDRFRQADSTTARRHGGLGLGLAIVRHLVELHGGTVRADSPGEGKGSSFTVLLPLSANTERFALVDRSSQRSVAFDDLPSLDGLRILLVDDELECRARVAGLLESCEAVVHAVASTAEAFSVLDEFRPDVLVSDIGMPGEDGYALIRQLRALEHVRWGHLPAVALLSYPNAEDRIRALAAGYQMHVPKPIDAAELVTTCASLSGRRVSGRSATALF